MSRAAGGLPDVYVGDTITDRDGIEPPDDQIDPPTVAMDFIVQRLTVCQ